MAALADMLLEGTPSAEQAARALALYREAAAVGYSPAALKSRSCSRTGRAGNWMRMKPTGCCGVWRMLQGIPKAMYMLAQVYYTRGDEAQEIP